MAAHQPWIHHGMEKGLQHDPKAFTVHVSNTSFLYPVDDFLEVTPEGVEYHKIMNVGPGEMRAMQRREAPAPCCPYPVTRP